MRFIATLIVGMIAVCLAGCGGQEKSQTAPADYFGQEPPGSVAVRFASDIVSTNGHEHSRIEFSKDGRELYWVTVPVDSSNIFVHGTPFQVDKQNIWYSTYDGQVWSPPDTLPFHLPAKQSPAFMTSQDILFFASIVSDSNLTRQHWRTSRTDGGWARPARVSALPLPPRNASYCFAANGNVYFDAFAGINEQGRPSWDIYMAEFKDGAYSMPRMVGGGVNDGDINWTPWIAPDESYLIFSSHRSGHFGDGDLYICFRDGSGNWGQAKNLGQAVNTSSQERFPSVSPDGKYLFFARNMEETYSDIFWIDAAIIEEVKKAE